VSLFATLIPLLPVLVPSLFGIGCGFFPIHDAAVANTPKDALVFLKVAVARWGEAIKMAGAAPQ